MIAEDKKATQLLFTRRIRSPPMAAIHLASCDLVAFLRTFDRLQRSPFFIKASTSLNHEHWLGSGSRPSDACTAHCISCLENVSPSYAPESSIKVSHLLKRKERCSPFGRFMREARQLAVAVNARRLVSVRRRGNLSATFMAMTESASQSLHHCIFLLLVPNVQYS